MDASSTAASAINLSAPPIKHSKHGLAISEKTNCSQKLVTGSGKPLSAFVLEARSSLSVRDMAGEEMVSPVGPKVVRFLYSIGAGFICAIAINKWRELEKKGMKQQQQQQIKGMADNSSDAVAEYK